MHVFRRPWELPLSTEKIKSENEDSHPQLLIIIQPLKNPVGQKIKIEPKVDTQLFS